jgi:hypothetical protein
VDEGSLMDYRAMFQGDYLTAPEFNGRTPTFTIVGVKIVRLPNPETGDEKAKGTIQFKEIERGLVLNRTNGQAIAAMFGNETNNWMGKRITLHAVEVMVGKKKDIGIRVLGSPDITQPVTFDVVLPRKKPKATTMVPTGNRAGAAQQLPPSEAPPPRERETGEDG